MAENENIGGISIPIEAPLSEFLKDLGEAENAARTAGANIASALDAGAASQGVGQLAESVQKVGEAAGQAGAEVRTFDQIVEQAVASGSTLTEAIQLATAEMERMKTGTSGAVEAVTEISEAEKAAAEAAQQLAAETAAATAALNEATNVWNSVVDSAFAAKTSYQEFSDIAQGVINRQSEVEAAVKEAAAALQEIYQAYQHGRVSAETLTRAQEELQQAMQKTGTSVKDTGKAVEESASGFSSMGEAVAHIAGALGLAVGAFGLVKESLTAFGQEERTIIATSALMGTSIEEAASHVEGLKQMAVTLGVANEALQTASLRLTAYGVTAGQIPMTLTAIADAAGATARGFDSIASAVERMSIGGMAGSRQLAMLGITAQELGATLGVMGDQVQKAFKSLDLEDRVQALTITLQKFEGIGEQVAQGIAGQWQALTNQTSYLAQSIGKELAPAAEKVIGVFSEILKTVGGLIQGLAGLNTWMLAIPAALIAIKLAAEASTAALSGMATAIAVLGGIKLGQALGEWIDRNTKAYQEGLKSLTDYNAAMLAQYGLQATYSGDLQKFLADTQAAITQFNNAMASVPKQFQAQFVSDLKELAKQGPVTALALNGLVMQYQQAALQAKVAAQGTVSFADALAKASETLGVTSIGALIVGYEKAGDAVEVFRKARERELATDLDVERAMAAQVEAARKLTDALYPLADSFKSLGIQTDAQITRKLEDAEAAFRRIADTAGSTGDQISRAFDAVEEAVKKANAQVSHFEEVSQQLENIQGPINAAKQWEYLKSTIELTAEFLPEVSSRLHEAFETVFAGAAKQVDDFKAALDNLNKYSPDALQAAVNAAKNAFDVLVASGKATQIQLAAAFNEYEISVLQMARSTGKAVDETWAQSVLKTQAHLKTITSLAGDEGAKLKQFYASLGREVEKVIDSIAGGLADLITKGGDFGEKMKNIFLDVANSIIKYLIKGALNDLIVSVFPALQAQLGKTAASLTGLIELFGGGAKTIAETAKIGAEAASGLNASLDAIGKAAGVVGGGTSAASATAGAGTTTTGGVSSLLSEVAAPIANIVTAIEGLLSYLQGRRVEQDVGRIEVTTRRIENILQGVYDDGHATKNNIDSLVNTLFWNPLVTYLQLICQAVEAVAAGGTGYGTIPMSGPEGVTNIADPALNSAVNAVKTASTETADALVNVVDSSIGAGASLDSFSSTVASAGNAYTDTISTITKATNSAADSLSDLDFVAQQNASGSFSMGQALALAGDTNIRTIQGVTYNLDKLAVIAAAMGTSLEELTKAMDAAGPAVNTLTTIISNVNSTVASATGPVQTMTPEINEQLKSRGDFAVDVFDAATGNTTHYYFKTQKEADEFVTNLNVKRTTAAQTPVQTMTPGVYDELKGLGDFAVDVFDAATGYTSHYYFKTQKEADEFVANLNVKAGAARVPEALPSAPTTRSSSSVPNLAAQGGYTGEEMAALIRMQWTDFNQQMADLAALNASLGTPAAPASSDYPQYQTSQQTLNWGYGLDRSVPLNITVTGGSNVIDQLAKEVTRQIVSQLKGQGLL